MDNMAASAGLQRAGSSSSLRRTASSGSLGSNKGRSNSNNGKRGKSRRNVLIITPVYPPVIAIGGGVAVTYGALATKLQSMGHHVEVLSPRLNNLDHGTSILYKNFPVIFPTWSNLETIVEATERCDVVVCPDDCGLVFYAFIALWKKKPLLFNMHTNVKMVLDTSPEFILRWFAAPIVGGFFNVCSHLSTKTMTTSPSYRDVLVQTGHRCDGVFSPRIKTAVFEKDDEVEDIHAARLWLCGNSEALTKQTVLIYAGRFSHEKRIDAVAAAKPENCVLAIVGDGPQAQELLAKCHDPKRGVFVHVGMQDQERLRVLYKASDFLVSASKFETLGMTVLESHLCGTPVAVQKAAGFISQVTENENGFFIDFDTPDLARAQLEHAIANKPSKEMIAETVKQRWDNGLEELDDVVLNLANEGRKAGVTWWMWPAMVAYYIIYSVLSYPFNTLTNRVVRVPRDEEKFTRAARKSRNARKAAKRKARAVVNSAVVAAAARPIATKMALKDPQATTASDNLLENHPIVFFFSLCWFWAIIQPLLGH